MPRRTEQMIAAPIEDKGSDGAAHEDHGKQHARDSQSLHELSDEFEPEEFPTLDQQPTTRD